MQEVFSFQFFFRTDGRKRERDSSHSRSLLLARSLLGEKKMHFASSYWLCKSSWASSSFANEIFHQKKDSLVKAAWPTFHLALCAAGWFFIICAMPCNDDLLLSFLWKRKEKVKWILLMWIFTIWTSVHTNKNCYSEGTKLCIPYIYSFDIVYWIMDPCVLE